MKFLSLLLLLLLAGALPARAGVDQISEKEFRALAAELAPKVNLFRDAWDKDPDAQFYGGTTRDYLYWLKGKFRGAHSPAEAAAVIARLRAEPVIDVRSFIIGDSDVDVFSDHSFEIHADDYGVRKIDTQRKEVLDPTSVLGRNEVDQGFIPAEKIRLSRQGLEDSPTLGDGVKEIYTGKLTVHFADPETFAKSKYAAEGINHPILLALRYLRLQAINYFQERGAGVVDKEALFAQLDPISTAKVREVVETSLASGDLKAPLAQAKFRTWLNAGIQKAFRSYTNPNAAKALMEEFQVTELPLAYPGAIEPVNQYVFAKHRDEAAARAALRDFGTDERKLFRSPSTEFPDGYLYHGTREEPAFRSILFQGVLGSESGVGGPGLYGVNQHNKAFSETWGGAKERLLRFPVKNSARIVDVTSGEGERVWKEFLLREKIPDGAVADGVERFAERFNADIVAYPYNTRAYVVKNSEALGKAEGVYRQLLPFPELLEKVKGMTDLEEFSRILSVNNLNKRERELARDAAAIPVAAIEEAIGQNRHVDLILGTFFSLPAFRDREDLVRTLIQNEARGVRRPNDLAPLARLLASPPWSERNELLSEFLHLGPGNDEYMAGMARQIGAPARRFTEEFLRSKKKGDRSFGYRLAANGILDDESEATLLHLALRKGKEAELARRALADSAHHGQRVSSPEVLNQAALRMKSRPGPEAEVWSDLFYHYRGDQRNLIPYLKDFEALIRKPWGWTEDKIGISSMSGARANIGRTLNDLLTPEGERMRISLYRYPPDDRYSILQMLPLHASDEEFREVARMQKFGTEATKKTAKHIHDLANLYGDEAARFARITAEVNLETAPPAPGLYGQPKPRSCFAFFRRLLSK